MNRTLNSIGRFISSPIYFSNLFLKSLNVFRNPFDVFYYYVTKTRNPRVIHLKNGLSIELSNDKDDISTVFIVFVKKDYGEITGDNILDIGANIGLLCIKWNKKSICF